MKKEFFCSKCDHTVLGWTCTKEMVKQACDEAIEYGFASVCVNPDYVKYVSSLLEGRAGVSCVCGFPCGANTIETKIFEGLRAISDGATDLDCVTNFGHMRNGDHKKLLQEYKDFVKAAKDKKPETVVKYIIYQPYGKNPFRTLDETKLLCELITESGADYIKFFCDPDEIKPYIGKDLKMKFSGCFNLDVSVDAVRKGCERVGEDLAAEWLKATPDSYWD